MEKASSAVSLGPAGETLRANVRRLRQQKGWTLRELSDLLADHGYSIAQSALSKVENGTRRADADDIAALAGTFDVDASTLLMPASGAAAIDAMYELDTARQTLVHAASKYDEARLNFGRAAEIAADQGHVVVANSIYEVLLSPENVIDHARGQGRVKQSGDFENVARRLRDVQASHGMDDGSGR